VVGAEDLLAVGGGLSRGDIGHGWNRRSLHSAALRSG
jgi:hypothetical protein